MTVVLGITSGIAAIKVQNLIPILKKEGVDVYVILTDHAKWMVDVKEIERVSGNKVYSSLFEEKFNPQKILKNHTVDHIDLADRADLLVVVPATANIIGKIAAGIADDFLTTAILATSAPVLLCPSMNSNMWANEIVQENLEKLRKRNFQIIPPVKGPLACGYEGEGKLPNVEDICTEILSLLKSAKYLKGKRILITAGGTYEPIDAVRGITNQASGKMGRAIAEEAYQEGATVLLVHSKTSVKSLYPIPEKIFQTSEELKNVIKKYILEYDYIFHTAAVSDYHLAQPLKGKVDSGKDLTLKLIPAEKIISQIKKWNSNIKLIEFKAVYRLNKNEMIEKAKEKLKEAHADFIAVNDVGRNGIGFGVDENEILLISKSGSATKLKKGTKKEIARKLLSLVIGR